MPSPCAITAVVPTFERVSDTLDVLAAIKSCDPFPDEIIVHSDGGRVEVAEAVAARYPDVRILNSSTFQGPGGARNLLIAAASNELVANFDDDSHPNHPDYFRRILEDADKFPEAAIISAASQPSEWKVPAFQSIAMPSGCGCVFRKKWFQRTKGFVPLRIAYCMEEVDLGLQLHSLGALIVHDPFLRVQHNREPAPNIDADTNATALANTALFAFLRYPAWLWPAGVMQVVSRLAYLLAHRWTAGLMRGLLMTPGYLAAHARHREPVSARVLASWMALRRHPKDLARAVPCPGQT